MNAAELTKALAGRWSGNSGIACCPSHPDKTPSLSIRDGDGDQLLTHCFAGCSHADVWAALRDRGLVERAEGRPGDRRRRRRPERPGAASEPRNLDRAREIWAAARPAEGSPVEQYLRGRGITIPIPSTLRYHPALLHPDIGQHLPAMVAAVCNVERNVTGIQRTFLTMDGRKAPLTRPKMAMGALRGNAVRLAPTSDRVWLTEGVEDAVAVVQMMGEPAWAVLGTSNFKTVELPESIRQVILASDGDAAGQAIIQDAAHRLAGQGREVRAAKLPPGKDWCDVLDEYEERAGILEYDLENYRPEAEAQARREVIHG